MAKLSAPLPPKNKRPSFSAPSKPVAKDEDVLDNHDEEISILRDIDDAPAPRSIEKEMPAEAPKPPVIEKVVEEVVEKDMPDPEKKPKQMAKLETKSEDLNQVLDDIEKDEEVDMPTQDGSSVSIINLVVFVLLLLFGIVGWFMYLQEKGTFATVEVAMEQNEENAEPTAAPTPEPTVTVTQLTREEITLEVLNGSGVAGAAGDTASVLEELGYPSVEVGNTSSVEGNELYVNPEYQGQVEVLMEDLATELDISTVSGELTDSDLVGRIVLGE